MANKNKKSPAQQAAEQTAAQQAPKTENPAAVAMMNGVKKASLSPDATVAALTGLKEMIHDNPNAATYYNLSEDTIHSINVFTLTGFATVLAIEVSENKSPFAQKMLEKQIDAVNAISEFTGVSINTKALPAPGEGGAIQVPSTAIEVSTDMKKKIAAEEKLKELNPVTNPAEVTSLEQLAASLALLISKGNEGIIIRMRRATDFYRGYLTIQANKAEDKKAALEEVKNMSYSELLSKMADVVGPCPVGLVGNAGLFRKNFVNVGTIIGPFCMYRRNADKIDTKGVLTNDFIADLVRIMISWSCKEEISKAEKGIKENERIIKKNEDIVAKNESANDVTIAKAAINTHKGYIEKCNNTINEMNGIIIGMNNPAIEDVDNLIDNFNKKDDTDADYKRAHLIVDQIINTYYKGTDLTKVDMDSLLHNVQQRAGIIINLFRDPLSRSIAYSEANITEIAQAETPAEEEQK
jgi:hypothetical protein